MFLTVLVMAMALQSTSDCNSVEPDWKLDGTNCSIDPYYYKVELYREASLDCGCTGDDDHDYDLSGSSTEYIKGYRCKYGDNLTDIVYYYDCKEPEYSCNDYPYCMPDCTDTHPRYGCWMFCYECNDDYDSCTSQGSWQGPDGKLFKRLYTWTDSGTCSKGNDYTQDFKEELTITAIFDKPSDPNCYRKPEVRVSQYDSRVLVKAKNGDVCCDSGSSQTIQISCSGASHIKNVKYTQDDGQLYTVFIEKPEDVDECDMNNHSSASVKIKYIPRHNQVEYKEGLEETVEVSCDFYDGAGNSCGSGNASITFTLGCPPPPDKG